VLPENPCARNGGIMKQNWFRPEATISTRFIFSSRCTPHLPAGWPERMSECQPGGGLALRPCCVPSPARSAARCRGPPRDCTRLPSCHQALAPMRLQEFEDQDRRQPRRHCQRNVIQMQWAEAEHAPREGQVARPAIGRRRTISIAGKPALAPTATAPSAGRPPPSITRGSSSSTAITMRPARPAT